jgi:hypothetical protein
VNTTYTGGLKGSVKGIELQATLPFGRLVHRWTDLAWWRAAPSPMAS